MQVWHNTVKLAMYRYIAPLTDWIVYLVYFLKEETIHKYFRNNIHAIHNIEMKKEKAFPMTEDLKKK